MPFQVVCNCYHRFGVFTTSGSSKILSWFCKQKIIVWGQIRWIGRVFFNFKFCILDSTIIVEDRRNILMERSSFVQCLFLDAISLFEWNKMNPLLSVQAPKNQLSESVYIPGNCGMCHHIWQNEKFGYWKITPIMPLFLLWWTHSHQPSQNRPKLEGSAWNLS